MLLMEIEQIIKCGSSLDPPPPSPPNSPPHHLLWGAAKPEIRLPSLPLLAAFLVFAFSLAFCVGLAKLLLLFQLLRQHRNFRLVYKFILLVHKKKKKRVASCYLELFRGDSKLIKFQEKGLL